MAHTEQLHQAYIQIQCQALDRLTPIEAGLSLLKVWSERHKQRRVLLTLPLEMLDDIGISQSEAQLESQKWFWEE